MPSRGAKKAEAAAVRFVDFAVRGWREGPYLQVIAHSTPAGSMRQPVGVRLGPFDSHDYRLEHDAPLSDGAELGRQLARLLLPDPIWRLLGQSLRVVAPHPNLGLRLRLCLDDDLIDLPWEYLYRPDVKSASARSGFLLMDGRISLVREPSTLVAETKPSERTQRGLFVGTLFEGGHDGWAVHSEYESLTEAMEPVRHLLDLDFVHTDDVDSVESALAVGCDLFHYAGHTHVENGRGALVQLACSPGNLEATDQPATWVWSDNLAPLLSNAGVRLAVFNACNSGLWPFIRPFMQAGIPAVVAVQGMVSNEAALRYAARLYESLAVGLSLDEALTYARLSLFEPQPAVWDCDWGRFMAYMPTESAVLFPRHDLQRIQSHQHKVREAREKTLQGVQTLSRKLDGADVSRVLSDIAERSVLILGRFSDERKSVLLAIKQALSSPPHRYLPILFDFEKPGDRDLIESILRFAAVSRFAIADLSDPKSLPAELQAIVPQFPSLPIVPIIESSQRQYAVAYNVLRRESVTKPVVEYRDEAHLLEILVDRVLAPAEALYHTLNPGILI